MRRIAKLVPRRPLLFGIAVFFLLGNFVFFSGQPEPMQPIAFSHAKHIQSGLNCTDCHAGARTAARATLPTREVCMGCHETALTQSREEARLRALASAGRELEWRRVFRVPAHVFFSHRRHVEIGGLNCAECHGAMETLTSPPVRPFKDLSMDACIGCHKQRGARADCNDCHV